MSFSFPTGAPNLIGKTSAKRSTLLTNHIFLILFSALAFAKYRFYQHPSKLDTVKYLSCGDYFQELSITGQNS